MYTFHLFLILKTKQKNVDAYTLHIAKSEVFYQEFARVLHTHERYTASLVSYFHLIIQSLWYFTGLTWQYNPSLTKEKNKQKAW